MVQLVRRTLYSKTVAQNTDELVAVCWLPSEGKLVSASVEIHCMAVDIVRTSAALYGTNGFLIPVDDPDAVVVADTLWDRHVPKDVDEAAGAYDLDTASVDAEPEYEEGLADLSGLFGSGPVRLSGAKRRRLITLAEGTGTYEGGAADLYVAHDRFTLKIGPTRKVEQPHAVCIGFSAPALTDTTTTQWMSPAEDEWTNLQFPVWTMEQAMVELLGQVEAGAESPFEDASAFLLDFLEPDVYEQSAARFAATNWEVYCRAKFVMEVPGRMRFGRMDSDA